MGELRTTAEAPVPAALIVLGLLDLDVRTHKRPQGIRNYETHLLEDVIKDLQEIKQDVMSLEHKEESLEDTKDAHESEQEALGQQILGTCD
ncbi:hypothetical protein NDU88_010198 [Pleurodeles waltl]|uniref:Uncharacterized protein n=1 Tax=Pleurodeles waltl TaxID=8319 RepID=A0AAV7QTT1_PLEWA|nr:hypothetical protein NDU88_010198 [Pleurodeles waltl]